MPARLQLLIAVCVTAITAAAVTATAATAAPADGGGQPAFRSPFTCGQTWFARTYSGHAANAVDWNMDGSGEADHGQPVFASAPGVTRPGNESRGYGRFVVVDHGNGWSSMFAHLSEITVREGQAVDATTMIGRVGRSGHADASHLHLEQRRNGRPQPVTLDGGLVAVSRSSRGASHVSRNCGSQMQRASVELFADAARTVTVATDDVAPGALLFARVTAPAGLHPEAPITSNADGPSVFATKSWSSPRRPDATISQRDGSWAAEFALRTPNREGVVSEDFTVGDGLGFMVAATLRHHVRWQVNSVGITLDRAGRVSADNMSLTPGQVAWAHLDVINTGTLPWSATNNAILRTLTGSASKLAHPDWRTVSEPWAAVETVGVGGRTKLVFPVLAPRTGGRYQEDFAPFVAGRTAEGTPATLVVNVRSERILRLAPAMAVVRMS